jgi:hypothetical protein
VDWNGYEIFDVPGEAKPLHLASRSAARTYFRELMSTKDERILMLGRLVQSDGIELDESEESVQRLNDWFVEHVERDPDDPTRLRGRWLSVAQDIGLYLAEIVFRAAPHLKWAMDVGTRHSISYQRPVLTGFRNVPYPRFTVDPAFAISQYGLEVIEDDDFSREQFLDIVRLSIEDA